MNKISYLPRIRTIQEAYAEIKEQDPNTALTPYAIRRMVKDGTLSSFHSGNRTLVNLDTLEEYLSTPTKTTLQEDTIRRISTR